MSKTISCTVKNNSDAEKILKELELIGFSNKNISLLFPEPVKNSNETKEITEDSVPESGILTWLAGVRSFTIPGIGTVIASGPIMAALHDPILLSSEGCMLKAFVDLGMQEHEAKNYEGKIKEGLILISAHTEDAEKEKRGHARRIFKDAEAHDISENYETVVI